MNHEPLIKFRTLITTATIVGAALFGYYTYSRISESRRKIKISQQKPSNKSGLTISGFDIEKAKSLKAQGNQAYTEGDLIKASQLYTEALSNYPENDPDRVLTLSNRAACFLAKGDYERVISDCSDALAQSPLYIKALNRRARAYEAIGSVESALIDWTACCVIESFSNPSQVQNLERALKEIAEAKATDTFKV